MREQFDAQFPAGFAVATTEELQPIYDEIAQAIIDGNAEAAIAHFREMITQLDTPPSGKHFNMQHLVAAYMAYIDNFDRLANWTNRDMFWVQVIGYVLRQMPANYAQAHCSGLKNVLDKHSAFKRTLAFVNGGKFFPLAVDSGLGFDFLGNISTAGEGGAGLDVKAPSPLTSGAIVLAAKLFKTKTRKLPTVNRKLEPCSARSFDYSIHSLSKNLAISWKHA